MLHAYSFKFCYKLKIFTPKKAISEKKKTLYICKTWEKIKEVILTKDGFTKYIMTVMVQLLQMKI